MENKILNLNSRQIFEENKRIFGSRRLSEKLKEAGFIGSEIERIKILGNGKLTKALTIKAHKCSESAKKALDAIGAKVEYLKR